MKIGSYRKNISEKVPNFEKNQIDKGTSMFKLMKMKTEVLLNKCKMKFVDRPKEAILNRSASRIDISIRDEFEKKYGHLVSRETVQILADGSRKVTQHVGQASFEHAQKKEAVLTRTINTDTSRKRMVFGSIEDYKKSKLEKEKAEKEYQDREMYF
ncbi:hypothetical protein COA01_23145 [Bacillus cereus]|uniref:hypothetical protein n=1 Tax=Bacillus cereus TaxID=1396 RepID=UPI000BFBF14E|nr:hypothetical protein [Bacillus cereus]PGP18641.1 hypothetical protein COA01_23145 [Bacillus cereus]